MIKIKYFLSVNVLITSLLLDQASARCLARDSEETLKNISTLSFQDLKNEQINYFIQKPNQFCFKNLQLRYLNTKIKSQQEYCDLSTTDDLAKSISIDYVNDLSIWSWSITPSTSAKLIANTAYLPSPHFNALEVDFYPQNIIPNKTLYHKKINEYLDSIEVASYLENATTAQMMKLFCSAEGFEDTKKCSVLLSYIKNKFGLRGEFDVINVDVWKRITGSDQYDLGIKYAYNKIINESPLSTNRNFYTDFLESFLKSGLTPQKAEQATWDLLSFFSNQGASIGTHMMFITHHLGPGKYPKSDGKLFNKDMKAKMIGTIGSFVTYYDHMKSLKGQNLYSLPQNVQSNCDNSKPYHFWMTAFIARDLVLNKIASPREAALAAFLAQKGYQLNRDIAGNGAKSIHKVGKILYLNDFDPTHQVVRMDLTNSIIGAHFGAQSTTKNTITYKFEDLYLEMLKKAGQKHLGSVKKPKGFWSFVNWANNIFGSAPESYENYIKWNNIFNPNPVLEKINSSK